MGWKDDPVVERATKKPVWQSDPIVKATPDEATQIEQNRADPANARPLRVDIMGDSEDKRPTSFGRGFLEGVTKPLNNAASALEYGANQIGIGGAIDSLGSALGLPSNAEAQQAQQASQAASPYQGSGFGRFLGEAAGTLPTAMIPGGLLAQGAASGALLTDSKDASGVAWDALTGAAGSRIGGAVMNRAAGLVAPRVNAAVRTLVDEGIRPTLGQIAGTGGRAGRALNSVESSLANFPIIGAPIQAARQQAVDDLNRAATRRALTPIGGQLPDDVATGHDAIRYAGDRLRDAYADVLPRLNGNIDQTFATRVNAVRQRAALPPEYDAQLGQIQTELSNAFDPSGSFRGRDIQRVSDRLDKLASGWRQNPNDPYLREVGEVAEQMRQQLHALVRRNNPAASTRLRNIDRGYASLVRTERAALNSADGVFTPDAYKQAVRSTDRSVRSRGVARGQALDQDLSAAGASVLPSRVGTGGSTAVNSLGMLGALTAGAAGGQPAALGILGGAAVGVLPYTELGGRAVRGLLTRQSGPSSQRVADILRLLAPAGGAAGATATPLLQSETQ